ncbi:MAG: lipoyl(octanoyl) transferase LipB [Rickettsiaceae bacterium]
MPEWVSLKGLINYSDAVSMMQQHVDKVIEGSAQEVVFLLEHEDVYTTGTSYDKRELLNTQDIPVIHSRRGGRVTYHGPGQRVIYPILNLTKQNRAKDIRLYIRNLEQWAINSLAAMGVKAYTIDGMVGIWVDKLNQPAKIGAIGVRVKKWITYYGMAINISTDLKKFSGIIPCGINNFPTLSLNDLGITVTLEEFDTLLQQEFKEIF